MDSDDLILSDSNKKRYSSSCFYGQGDSRFPTIEEQVALCRKIASQLINDANQNSKGSSMFYKRFKRAPKWVHQSKSNYDETNLIENENKEIECMKQRLKEEQSKTLKLILDPRMIKTVERLRKSGVDFNEHNVVSPEICLHLVKDLNSPQNNKGAKLFLNKKEKSIDWVLEENEASKEIRKEKERKEKKKKEKEDNQKSFLKQLNVQQFQDSTSFWKVDIGKNACTNINQNLQTVCCNNYSANFYSTLPRIYESSKQFTNSINNSLSSWYKFKNNLCLPRIPKSWVPKETLQTKTNESNCYQAKTFQPTKDWTNYEFNSGFENKTFYSESQSFSLKSRNMFTLPKYRNFNSIPKGFCKKN